MIRRQSHPGRLMRRTAFAFVTSALLAVCFNIQTSGAQSIDDTMKTTDEFTAVLTRVSEGWETKNTDLAMSAFSGDALYTEPPDRQIYRGTRELRIFFDRITPGATLKWQNIWYDPQTLVGAGAYSFKNGERSTAVHGVVVVLIQDGKIKTWREYQRRGEIDFEDFHNPDSKEWQTTVDDL
ncbi:MAG: nuclear transport factor 2 family protein [Pseudomonadota bacterium]